MGIFSEYLEKKLSAIPGVYRLRRASFWLFARLVAHYFHKVFYGAGRYEGTWMDTWWMGTRIYKSPLDIWVFQEILFEKRPDVVIETSHLGALRFSWLT